MLSKEKFKLTHQQEAGIMMVKENNVSVLCGGPGTGKSTVVKEIVKWAESQHMKVLQSAPTGKAAKRMMEITKGFATTIHGMLGCEMGGNGAFRFIHNADKPLRANLVVIDEISMITTELMHATLQAIPMDGTKILFIGDQNQLPSVGPGAILRDLIDSGIIPITELDIIHRNTGFIVEACHMIKAGKVYTPHRMLDFKKENPVNLIHIECFSSTDTLQTIEKLVLNVLPAKITPGRTIGFDPLEDIQVISPVNKKGELSCQGINQRLRDALNPPSAMDQVEQQKHESAFKARHKKGEEITTKPDLLFRVGDKIIQTKNQRVSGKVYKKHMPEIPKNLIKKDFPIVNGDIGFVTEMDADRKNILVRFNDPVRFVKISRTNNDLLHAYCITCHKFQGSEAPVIIIPADRAYSFIMYNAWIYTAISRAKVICVTVGSFQAIEKAIENIRPNDRITRLKERLHNEHRSLMVKQFSDI